MTKTKYKLQVAGQACSVALTYTGNKTRRQARLPRLYCHTKMAVRYTCTVLLHRRCPASQRRGVHIPPPSQSNSHVPSRAVNSATALSSSRLNPARTRTWALAARAFSFPSSLETVSARSSMVGALSNLSASSIDSCHFAVREATLT